MDQKKIGAFLKTLRTEKGLTQEQLAEQFHVSSRTVSRWETGSNMPDISLLAPLADFYDVDVREIMEGVRKSGGLCGCRKRQTFQVGAGYRFCGRRTVNHSNSISMY